MSIRNFALTALLVCCASASFAQVTDVSVYGVAGRSSENWHGEADLHALNIEIGHALSPRTEIGFAVAPTRLWQPRSWFGDDFGDGNEHVRAVGASLLLRHKLNLASRRIHFYGEAGAGPMWAEKAVPASTSRFNFVTQLGAGVVLLPNARFPVIAGYRFLHVSNGGYAPRNPGLNFSSIVLGVRTATTRRRSR